ncbi:uncharacterized protein si:ch211-119e14.1 [Chelmon rostratus]|uniref:uncharacterized protein si:ch211-119e14.1 n=1 Tax=Chelmon rostratus TaxID=109905 RepID=UPI001BE58570|nr:uncharacterized protein si:ch211-119e14.1 [Chelmon rostratus]
MADTETMTPSSWTVLILFFCLIVLIVLLILLYKKLNREADGEYTIRRMVYKEGGIRDGMRGAALALGTRLGVQLWPRNGADEDGEEMREVQDETELLEGGGSQGSDSEEEEEQRGETKGKGGDSSDDNSSLESSEGEEQTRLTDQPESKGETGEKGEEKEEKAGDGEGKGEASGGAGLLINLKQISGSATWSEVEGGEGKDSDITAL